MSVKQHPQQRSDRARIDYLATELDRWEQNLRSHYGHTHPAAGPVAFDEARRWKLDGELDMIAEIRDIIARRAAR